MTHADIIFVYKTLAELTGQMLIAAHNAEWELLDRLQVRCDEFFQYLRDNDTTPPSTEEDVAEKRTLIETVLRNQQQISQIVEPVLQQLSAQIKNTQNERLLVRAYGPPPKG